ncbi:MAG: prolipoprotein diacylglyceryl transferase [Dethiobacter sp.]|jgi:phosphatidylglycerol:prolipoprotein diacylglycerol transferase|nr:prolipoprotein diacylglyceryl transferase [Dethiobacter sp.]
MSAPRVLFNIGGFSLHLFGLMVALGFLAGTYAAFRGAEKKGYDKEKVADLLLYMLIGGVIGARVLYVVQNLGYFLPNPLSILSIHQGGLSFHGAFFGGAAVVFYYTRKHRLSFLELADILAPGLVIGYAIGRIGCDIYGNVTNVPWAVTVEGIKRHPVQLYSALAAYIIFVLLVERSKKQHFNGEIFLLFVASYSVYRFFIEFFRTASTNLIFSPAQYLSIITAAAGLLLLFLYKKYMPKQRGVQ